LDAVIVTADWAPGKTAPDPEETLALQNAAKAAEQDNVKLFLAVYNFDLSTRTRTDVSDPAHQGEFAAYAAALARALKPDPAKPTARYVIVGNEPNNERFWSPQYGAKDSDQAAVDYESLLARTYDAVKAVDPAITVIGGALSPRGVDKPKPGRDTHSPVTFIE